MLVLSPVRTPPGCNVDHHDMDRFNFDKHLVPPNPRWCHCCPTEYPCTDLCTHGPLATFLKMESLAGQWCSFLTQWWMSNRLSLWLYWFNLAKNNVKRASFYQPCWQFSLSRTLMFTNLLDDNLRCFYPEWGCVPVQCLEPSADNFGKFSVLVLWLFLHWTVGVFLIVFKSS